ncbi:MAG: hypothetical protein H6Q19_608 [Bacteroidetes bacterium]|nr:hypothetical protein [Bacteroidota bacterium]
MENTNNLTPRQRAEFLDMLKKRFEKNRQRHPEIDWERIHEKLKLYTEKTVLLHLMETTGGEPDVVGYDTATDEYIFADCSAETPKGRRSLCYDREAWEARKEFKPKNNAVELAAEMGIELLSEDEYRELQKLGEFDLKTSSWVKTPAEIRSLGGAIFCDRRYNHVFTYHNGAESYYAVRGFRGSLRI